MAEVKKIAYLIPQFPGQTHGFFWREISEVEARGVQVRVFSTLMPPPGLISHAWSEDAIARTTYLFGKQLLASAPAVLRIPWGAVWRDVREEGPKLAKEILLCMPAAHALAKACRADGITHVHAHSCARSALIGALAKLVYGLDYSVTLHGPMSDYGIGQKLKWRHAKFATVITEKLRQEIERDLAGHLPSDISIRPMGVDVEDLKRPAPYIPARKGETVRIFACGRLNVVKGHQDLCDAVNILVGKGHKVSLEIAGEDDDGGSGFRKVLAQKIEMEKLGESVQLLGAIDASAVRQKLLEAHIFVLASWHEPLGVAYMEAMSCEVPTIGTDSGGVRELITNGVDGYLVSPKSPPELAAAIEEVLVDPERAMRIAQAGRERIVQSFRSSLGAETILEGIARPSV